LTLEVFHDVKKLVIDLWPIDELDLDGVEIAECISDVEWSAHFRPNNNLVSSLEQRGTSLWSMNLHVDEEKGVQGNERIQRKLVRDGDGEGQRRRGRVEERKRSARAHSQGFWTSSENRFVLQA
jgi:hypothetical protein